MSLIVGGMKHYTLLEAAKLLNTTDSTLRKKIKNGLVQAQLVNGLTYVTESELYRLQDEKPVRKLNPRA